MTCVLLIEPYYSGSHQAWADGYQAASAHDVRLLTLPGNAWKWRMQGGAVTLARQLGELSLPPDVVLASDMMDLSTFRALTRHRLQDVPHAFYFHENQLTYPQNARQNHGWRYGIINYISAMSADQIFFNSRFHQQVFFEALPRMLKNFPDYNELASVDALRARSAVLPLGLRLSRFDAYRVSKSDGPPLIVWNHRWEADKNPRALFKALDRLIDMNLDFRVAVVGENVRHDVPEFDAARERLGERVVQWGYLPDFASYARLLWQADYVISTARQEFFGGAVAEALYCECVPLLPNRLNYPYLLPKDVHEVCLFRRDGDLTPLLAGHMRGAHTVNPVALREYIAQHDWSRMAPRYDAALTRLAQAPRRPPPVLGE